MHRFGPHTSPLIACAAAFVCLFQASTASAVVVYDEKDKGDLPGQVIDAEIIKLLWGPNEFKGTVGGVLDPADSLQVEVLPEQKVDDIVVNFPVEENPEPGFIFVTVFNVPSVGSDTVYGLDFPSPGPVSLFDQTPVSGPPLQDLAGGIHGMRMKMDIDPAYSITFIVSPEPGTAVLYALASLTLVRRRLA